MPDNPTGAPDEPVWIPPASEAYDPSTSTSRTSAPPSVPSPSEQASGAAATQPVTDVGMSGGGPQASFAGPVTMPDPAPDVPPSDPTLPEFDQRCREDFEGLCYIGYLTDTFEWMGHRFAIRTLTMDQLLVMSLLHARYRDTIGDVKAYQSLTVAGCLISVDGQHLPVPSFVDEEQLDSRFRYVTQKWFPWTFDAVYEKYLELEARVLAVMDAMGKALGSKASTRTSNTASV